ncbi:MAG: small basic family protein [Clostridia bacterium]|nr:small basic family protein [Clostridia bacterium]
MIILIGAVLGLLIAFIAPVHIPPEYTKYAAIGILAALDSVFGGISAYCRRCFDLKVFLSGFLVNTLLAAGLTFIGSKLDIDMSLAAIVTFGSRLFQNLAEIRRYLLNKWSQNGKIKE